MSSQDRHLVKAFLEESQVATLASANPESGQPEAALLYYLYDNQDGIFFATSPESRKIGNITTNPLVALTINDAVKRQSIQIEGTATISNDAVRNLSILSQINKKITAGESGVEWPLLKLNPTAILIIQVKIVWLRFSSFDEPEEVVELRGTDLKEHLGVS